MFPWKVNPLKPGFHHCSPSLESWLRNVKKGDHPQMAELFWSVKYDNLPISRFRILKGCGICDDMWGIFFLCILYTDMLCFRVCSSISLKGHDRYIARDVIWYYLWMLSKVKPSWVKLDLFGGTASWVWNVSVRKLRSCASTRACGAGTLCLPGLFNFSPWKAMCSTPSRQLCCRAQDVAP